MVGTPWKKKSRTERIAEDAWSNLVSAVESAGDAARSVGKRTSERVQDLAHDFADEASSRAGSASSRVGSASSRVGSAADEARARASAALDALSGRKPRKPWGWIAVAVLGGAALGWAAAASGTKAIATAVDKLSDVQHRGGSADDRRHGYKADGGRSADTADDGESGTPTPTGTTTGYETPAARSTGTIPSGPPAV